MRISLFSPRRRNIPGVSITSARPSSVRSSEPSFIWSNRPNVCSIFWPSKKAEPSEKWIRPDRAEITDCAQAGTERHRIKTQEKLQQRDVMRGTPLFKNPPVAEWCQGRYRRNPPEVDAILCIIPLCTGQ